MQRSSYIRAGPKLRECSLCRKHLRIEAFNKPVGYGGLTARLVAEPVQSMKRAQRSAAIFLRLAHIARLAPQQQCSCGTKETWLRFTSARTILPLGVANRFFNRSRHLQLLP